MKKDDLVKVIRAVVQQELKKELPKALGQVFAQMMGQSQPAQVHGLNMARDIPPSSSPVPVPDEIDETLDLKEQLKEMFNGKVERVAQSKPALPPKKFTNNPILNEVLNKTRPFNGSERMAMGVGGSGMSPAVAMAAGGYGSGPSIPATGVGELMESNELSFLDRIPGMPGGSGPVLTELPTRSQTLREGQEGGPAPLESMGNVSALDLKHHPGLPDSIKGILSRDYRSLVRAMDKKK